MTEPVLDWLPADALTDETIVGQLDETIAAWSDLWFGERGVQRIERPRFVDCGDSALFSGSGWQRLAAGVWIGRDEGARSALAWRALGYENACPRAAPADERLLSRFAERMARELARALASALRAKDVRNQAEPAAPPAGVLLHIGSGNGTVDLAVLVERSAPVQPRKALCPPWSPPAAVVRRLPEVLAPVPVEVEASIGIARASALELRDIAPGDVIVIDRATSDPVLLRSCETGAVVGRARLVVEDGGYLLRAC